MSDYISRQAAIDALDRIFDRCEEIEAHLPEGDPDRDGYKMYPDYMTVWKYLRQLPSAQPERKKRKWVEVAVTDGYDKDGIKTWISVMQCDQCGFIVNAVEGHMAQYNYCPNCGAQMMGGES